MSDLLKAVRQNEEFKAVMKDATKRRPIVPVFSICQTKDEQDMVVESIKYYTAMQKGFDLLYQHLTGESHGRTADD